MTSPTTQTLIATASNGATVTYRGRAEYAYAAVQVTGENTAALVARGFAKESVRSRARTVLGSYDFEVVPFRVYRPGPDDSSVPQKIRTYAENRRFPGSTREIPLIAQAYHQANGWVQGEYGAPTYETLRELRTRGVESIAVRVYGHLADFTIQELLAGANHPLLGGSLIGSRVR